jgi:hypothetical protein
MVIGPTTLTEQIDGPGRGPCHRHLHEVERAYEEGDLLQRQRKVRQRAHANGETNGESGDHTNSDAEGWSGRPPRATVLRERPRRFCDTYGYGPSVRKATSARSSRSWWRST